MIRKLIVFLLRLVELALLVGAACVLALTLVQLSSSLSLSLGADSLAAQLTVYLPSWLAYFFVVSSPFGGVFRTDFFIVAIAGLILARIVRCVYKGLE